MSQEKRSITSLILGYPARAGKRLVVGASAAGPITRGARGIAGAWRTITAQTEPGVAETFEQAIERLDLSDDDLNRRSGQLISETWIMVAIAIGLVAWNAWCALGAATAIDAASALLSTLLACLPLSLAMRSAFRQWQIRERRLGDFREWLAVPGQWIPRG